jgi:hypothetical protein
VLSNTQVLLLGAVGAFAPEILRLWTLRNNKQRLVWSNRYVLASAMMCALGSVVAFCLEPNSAWKALYAGLTAPIVITSAGRRLTGGPTKLKSGELKGGVSTPVTNQLPAPPSVRAFINAL